MANSDISITQGWSAGSILTEAQLDTAMADIETYINNRNNGVDQWKNVEIDSTNADPLEIKSSAATTNILIDNTATDGDPGIVFQLSGTTKYTMFVDDSDTDAWKVLNENSDILLEIPSSTAQKVLFADGSDTSPSIAFQGNPNSGFAFNASNVRFFV